MLKMCGWIMGLACAASLGACDADVLVGEFEPATDDSSSSSTVTASTVTASTGSVGTGGTGAAGAAGAAGGTSGAGGACIEATCQGRTYACGNCRDDDGDGFTDADDPDCLGACHNAEDTYDPSLPGQSGGNCGKDCYFDQDSGGGNDGCEWDHRCDTLEPTPACSSDPGAAVGSPPRSCDEVRGSQADQCLNACLPLVPNGCDCFGCCAIQGAAPVWLGSEINGLSSCTSESLGDPERCKPCTQVTSCLNPCEECELCVGKTELPASCESGTDQPPQRCGLAAQACGLVGQSRCPQDHYCITGCCVLTIK